MNTVLNNISQSRYFNDSTTNTKIEEIKKFLDSPSDVQKLESMKKLIAMLSKGRDVSEAFPQVVKNVIVKNLEIKKLVYMFLVHYAEIQTDSALLAINTIQKSLSDQSQVIRATALRVMSSIRVIDIIEVIILAIEKSVKDTSPFVRKAAAFAIAKVHKLDCDKEENLIDLLEVLLNDNSTMVLGAAMVAFNELCPQRFDLLHPHYRKICQLLADFDEWSQVISLDILTKYARTQFKCPDVSINEKKPNKKKSKSFYSDDEDDDQDDEDNKIFKKYDSFDASDEIDHDHRLLLKSTLPLLQSRNNAVVMAVSSLYFYCAPVIEAQKVGKSLVRILRSGPEVQYITLTNISTMVTMRPNMFEPHLSEFFINAGDPEYSIKLKLEILTRLATPENISRILKEFKEYVKNEDKKFVAATIQAIGSCATSIPDVTESCIYGLMSLLGNQSQLVVAESVVVLKRLLQLNAMGDNTKASGKTHQIKYDNIILNLAKLLDTLQVPSARASIIWVIGEYCTRIPLVAPDVLRKLTKTFADEHESVKLETLNLAAKLYIQFSNQPSETELESKTNMPLPNVGKNQPQLLIADRERVKERVNLIFQYLLNLAKYDQNYDIRDNSRIMKHFFYSTENTPSISENIKTIMINVKPIPTETSISEDRQRFTLGSLSHIVNHTALGYVALSDFPEVPPDSSVREPIQRWQTNNNQFDKRTESIFVETPFYSDDDEDEEEDDEDEDEEDDDEDEDDEDENDEDEYDQFFNDGSSTSSKNKKQNGKFNEEDYEQNIEDGDEEDFDELFGITSNNNNNNIDELSNEMEKLIIDQPINSTSIKKILLKPTISGGLGIEYCFIRSRTMEDGSQVEPRFNIIQLSIINQSEEPLSNISIINKNLIEGAELVEFEPIESIAPKDIIQKQIYVLFNSTSQSCKFEISFNKGNYPVTLSPIIGELITPIQFNVSSSGGGDDNDQVEQQQEESDVEIWKKEFEQLGELNQVDDQYEFGDQCLERLSIDSTVGLKPIIQNILDTINISPIASNKSNTIIQLAGTTLLKNETIFVLLEKKNQNNIKCTIRSNDSIVATMLLKKLSDILQK